MTTQVLDQFLENSGTVNLDAHTPDTDVVGGGWIEESGTWKVSDSFDAVYQSASQQHAHALIDCGIRDMTVTAELQSPSSGEFLFGVLIRYDPNNNDGLLFAWDCDEFDQFRWKLIRVDFSTGSYFTRVDKNDSGVHGNTADVRCDLCGDTIICYANGTEVLRDRVTGLTDTYVGVYSDGLLYNGNELRIDNFQCETMKCLEMSPTSTGLSAVTPTFEKTAAPPLTSFDLSLLSPTLVKGFAPSPDSISLTLLEPTFTREYPISPVEVNLSAHAFGIPKIITPSPVSFTLSAQDPCLVAHTISIRGGYLGRFQAGDYLPIAIEFSNTPTAVPEVTVYDHRGTQIGDTAYLAPIDPDWKGGFFVGKVFLDENYGLDHDIEHFTAYVSVTIFDVTYTSMLTFIVLPGGNSKGAYRSLYHYSGGGADYLVGYSDSDDLEIRRGPTIE